MFGAARILLMATFALAAVSVRGDVGWRNLDEAHHLCGRRASNGYLTGKIVMVCRLDAAVPASAESLPRLEAIWQSFKGPDFVLLGDFAGRRGTEESVRRLAKQQGLTFPVYADTGLAAGEPLPRYAPFVYVVDPTGRIRYRGKNERTATDVVVGLTARWQTPADEADWRQCLEFELLNLPAQAILRQEAFAKAFPTAAAEYEPQVSVLKRMPGMTELLKLLKVSRKVGAYPVKTEDERRKLSKRVAETVERYAFLKQSKDPQIAQEAKNAIAELQWAAVEK